MINAEDVHRQSFQPIGQFAGHRVTVVPTYLLEIGELRHFHAITPDFPTQTPCAQCRAFPVIFDKTDVVQGHINADGLKGAKIEILQIWRAGFDQNLVLVVMLQPVRVLAIAPIRGAARGLHIGRGPRLRAQAAQCGARMEGACAHFHIVGLQNRAALGRPIGLQSQDDFLKGTWRRWAVRHRFNPLVDARLTYDPPPGRSIAREVSFWRYSAIFIARFLAYSAGQVNGHKDH